MTQEDLQTRTKTRYGMHRLFLDPEIAGVPQEFPFRTRFSLRPLIDQWRQMAEEDPDRYGALLEELETRLVSAPEFLEPIEDFELLAEHDETLNLLLAPIFPRGDWTNELRGLIDPFGRVFVRRTPALNALMRSSDDDYTFRWQDETALVVKILYAYKFVLQEFYDTSMQVDQPIIQVIPSIDGAIDRYLKIVASSSHITVRAVKPLPELSSVDLEELLNDVGDLSLWFERIPPDCFEFTGFAIANFTDVTSEVATASIKHILLTSYANVTANKFEQLEHEVRTYFRRSNIRLGLATLQQDGRLNFTSERKIWNSLRIRDAVREGRLSVEDSIYGRMLRERIPVAIGNVAEWQGNEELKEVLREQGIVSFLLKPLTYEKRLVGLFELTSSEPGDLNALAMLKLKQIESIFALAVHQNREHFEQRISDLIRHTYTAIHPSVAWRFREAAVEVLEHQKRDDVHDAEPILFAGLYPIYGSADIRGSSDHRNDAVRKDLIEGLKAAREALSAVREGSVLTLADELNHRIDERIARLDTGLHSGDESDVQDFIIEEVDPFLELITAGRPDTWPVATAYLESLGSGHSSKRLKAYESSVKRINSALSLIVEREDEALQQIYPHFFEKFATDGVEYTAYIGDSLVPDRPYDHAFLHNMRLRQLIMSCEIARTVDQLKRELEVPLEIAQLILVQSMPVTIRFRMDEKRFDVEGAYGVRYEMVKKRIDKAHIKDKGERVTLPDRLAIIFSTEKEAVEYRRYLDYLQASAYITDEVEEFQVEELPGVSNLKAMRVRVNLETAPIKADASGVTAAVRALADR